MATFAKPSFDAASYLKFRPSYPPELFDLIYEYHTKEPEQQSWRVALDIGCGPGIVTSVLANKFDTVFGLDPSLPMLDEARINCSAVPSAVMDPKAGHARDVHFLRGCAENLSEFENESVDLITSAEAAHWFDHERAWPEMFRVLKKGGTIALWCYGEEIFPKFPKLTKLVYEFVYGEKYLGNYWDDFESIMMCSNLADLLPSPSSDSGFDLSTMKRLKFDGVNEKIMLQKKMTWELIEQMMRTWDGVFNYLKAHPDDSLHPGGDIVTSFMRKLELEAKRAGLEEKEVEIHWELGLVLIKK